MLGKIGRIVSDAEQQSRLECVHPVQAEEMEAEEREILAELGVSDPYAADSSDSGQDA